ncbi:Oca4 protein [Saccharomycopsis crataegensis]|uniref:Oca4 protein n=1 Tax=Saccharomycopsis crataegensis TaxID=43959 RepID=A0AAV5QPC4_9ASCO|nr:Oca4 protein [Saccharomycopsis crataegensis]
MLVPPTNFGIVEDGVYRASYLDSINFFFLETLHLKSILLVDAEKPPSHFYKFLHKNKIQLYQITNRKSKMKQDNDQGSSNHHSDKKKYQYRRNATLPGLHEPDVGGEDDGDLERNVIYIYNDSSLVSSSPSFDDSWMVMKRNLLSKIFGVVLDRSNYNLMIVDSICVVASLLRKIEKWNYSNLISEYRFYAGKNKTFQIENFLEIIQIELVPAKKIEDNNNNTNSDKSGEPSPSSEELRDNNQGKLRQPSMIKQKNSIESKRQITIPINQQQQNSQISPQQNRGSFASVWSGGSYEYYQSPRTNYRSPRNITQSTQDNKGDMCGSKVTQYSFKSQDDSYDNSYKSMLHSAGDSPGLGLSPSINKEENASSSPQIPNNLLRFMEIRKKNKQNFDEEDQKNSEDVVLPLEDYDKANGEQHKSLLSAELAHDKHLDETNQSDSINEEGLELVDNKDKEEYSDYLKDEKYFDSFYKPLSSEKFDKIKNHIKLKLPTEERLPGWFKQQRALWVEEYKEINGI